MNFAKLGLFRIIKVLGLVIYKLDLLDSIKIMRICYVLVLKLVNLEAPFMENILNINPKSQKKVWEIKEIINLRLIDNNK